ncbi:aminopeptidase P family protein [archaeon]|jgi:Xaa-Pro dipeptidase|nr:aminopeptidase P family protein [archaeon]MBT3451437.1 aminopeptidase P family protein [archaeon]MBT6869717.1 aminopeptidase P family protein [archaeon]MBT7192646.1 aminopeptidase P family protein [archaeon]MBT7380531.1 aminopeptidase P family protein [archaeon]
MWTEKQINQHIKASKILHKIRDSAISFMKNNSNCSEEQVRLQIISQFKEHNLITSHNSPIVAFNENSANPHYIPTNMSKKIKLGTIIKLDIWARVNEINAPYADLTWMAYKGARIPKKVQEIFEIVINSRDQVIKELKFSLKNGTLLKGKELDNIAREYISRKGYSQKFIHSLGHSLGLKSPHGKYGGLKKSNFRKIHKNLGYTIEPGIYLNGKFGIRSEIDFYINKQNKLILTCPLQKKIIRF